MMNEEETKTIPCLETNPSSHDRNIEGIEFDDPDLDYELGKVPNTDGLDETEEQDILLNDDPPKSLRR